MSDIELITSPDTQRQNRVPPRQRLVQTWPVLHAGPVPRINRGKWTFTVSGLVEKKRTLSYEEFLSLPRVKVFSDIHCVTGWSRLDNLWEGVSTAAMKQVASILPEARFAIVFGSNFFSTNLSLQDFFQSDALFALRHDGEDLTPEHGGPVRLVVPRLYFWKSAKWVTGVTFTAKDMPGFWESHGYHNHGDPWKEERYSR